MIRALLWGLLLVAGPAFADPEARRLLSAREAQDWAAVGRVNISGASFCTGTLIAPDLVLTAAHCVYFKATGRAVPPDRIHFLAGWRLGKARAHRRARAVLVHPGYKVAARSGTGRVAADIAVIALDRPISGDEIQPSARSSGAVPGEKITVVSYARNRPEAPSIEQGCGLIGARNRMLVLSCDVDFGASGAPVFVERDGRREIISVISAMAQWEGEKVALGTSLGRPLDTLLQRLRINGGDWQGRPGGQGTPRHVVRPPQ